MKKIILMFLMFPVCVFGQLSDQNYLNKYKSSVALFQNGNYQEAFNGFGELTNRKYENPIAPYAFLYSALSAEKTGYSYQAKSLFRTLFSFYPHWEKLDEAKILYAQLNFEGEFFNEAMEYLHQITDPKWNTTKENLMAEYLPKLPTLSGLKALYSKYPNYKPLAETLVNKIQSNRYNTQSDLELSDLLTNRFNIKIGPDHKVYQKTGISGEKTENLNFGILLPFELNSNNEVNANAIYVYDIYSGMKEASRKLKEEGITLNLYSFDIKNSEATFKKASSKENFSELDLIVGPLYANPNNLAVGFINKNDVVQVHPISNNLSLLKESKNSFLFQPSFEYQAEKALDFISYQGLPKSVSIYYGDTRKDENFANIYAAEAKKRGFKVNVIEKFEQKKLGKESGHVFFSGDSQGPNFLKTLEMSDIECETILTANSFNWNNLSPSTTFSNNHALIYPEFVNRNKESVKEFEKSYFEKYGTFPSYYVYLGYDLAYYFGNMLSEGKSVFKENLRLGEFLEGFMLSGYDFSGNVKQNRVVPIIKYRYGEFEEVFR